MAKVTEIPNKMGKKQRYLSEIRKELGFSYRDGILVLRLENNAAADMRSDVARIGHDMRRVLVRYGKKSSKQPVV